MVRIGQSPLILCSHQPTVGNAARGQIRGYIITGVGKVPAQKPSPTTSPGPFFTDVAIVGHSFTLSRRLLRCSTSNEVVRHSQHLYRSVAWFNTEQISRMSSAQCPGSSSRRHISSDPGQVETHLSRCNCY